MRYVSFIHRDDDTGYGISFPDSPGCLSVGDSVDEAIRHGREALSNDAPAIARAWATGATSAGPADAMTAIARARATGFVDRDLADGTLWHHGRHGARRHGRNATRSGNDMTTVDSRRYWLMALGEESRHWDSCHAAGIAFIGWDDEGDLRQYQNKDQLRKRGLRHARTRTGTRNMK